MFVMLLGSFTYAQTFEFDCIDYAQLRIDRVADVEGLGTTEVYALLAFQPASGTNSDTTATIIVNGINLIDYDISPSFIEYWEQSVYDTYLTDLGNKLQSLVLRNERLAILESVFNQYSTPTVSISLIDAADGSGDALLFSEVGGDFEYTAKLSSLIENLSSYTFEYFTSESYINTFIGIVQDELDSIAAAAKTAALEANETAYTNALDSNTATSTLDRETELERLSRDGIFVLVSVPGYNGTSGYVVEYHDENGLISYTYVDPVDGLTYNDSHSYPSNTDLDSITDYDTFYNNQVTLVRDLVRNLINN